MNRKSGVTLFELMVASVIVGILATALARSYAFAANYPAWSAQSRQRETSLTRLEGRLSELIRSAVLTSNANDPESYFLVGTEATGEESRVTFTTQGERPQGAVLASTAEFEEAHAQFGPRGAPAEISIGLTAVGESAGGTGLFLREQSPADGDPSQGGTESVLTSSVAEVSFELFDGTLWRDTWDTRLGVRRLPSAVRVTYRLDDEERPRILLIRLPHSDATPTNPVPEGTTN